MRSIFHSILMVLNLACAVFLLLACACCFVSPKILWWVGFFGMAYIHFLTVNILFVVFWALSRKKLFMLVSLAAILVGWPFAGRHVQLFAGDTQTTGADSSSRILSFNVQAFKQRNTRQPDGTELNLFDFIRRTDADIICLQEFLVDGWTKGLDRKSLQKEFGRMPYQHVELAEISFGVATFSKYPIVGRHRVYADRSTNVCIGTDLLLGGDTVRVYNVHLKSFGFSDEEKRLLNNAVKRDYSDSDVRTVKTMLRQMKSTSQKRARQVDILLAHMAQSPYPMIICGDFNDPPASHSYQKLRDTRKDAFVEAGTGRSTTYNIGSLSSQRIDYILFSDFFEASGYDSPRVRLSDHFPITCRLTVKEQR